MNPFAKWFLIGGGILTLCGPALGLLGTVIGMMSGFNILGTSGVADPKSLASNIGTTLMATTGGFVLGIVGVCILIAGIIILFATKKKPMPPPLPE